MPRHTATPARQRRAGNGGTREVQHSLLVILSATRGRKRVARAARGHRRHPPAAITIPPSCRDRIQPAKKSQHLPPLLYVALCVYESHSSHLPHSKRVFATGSLLVAASEPLPATGVHAHRVPTRLRPRLARGCESALRTALALAPMATATVAGCGLVMPGWPAHDLPLPSHMNRRSAPSR